MKIEYSYIHFPLVVRTKDLFFKWFEILRLTSALVLIIFIFVENGELVLTISCIMLLSLTLAGIVLNLSLKKYKTVGIMCLKENEIEIDNSMVFLLEDLTDIKIHYAGFEGEQYGYMGALIVKDGAESYISFRYKGEHYKKYFFIKNKGYAIALDSIIKIWKSQGLIFEVNDWYDKRIERIKDAKG